MANLGDGPNLKVNVTFRDRKAKGRQGFDSLLGHHLAINGAHVKTPPHKTRLIIFRGVIEGKK